MARKSAALTSVPPGRGNATRQHIIERAAPLFNRQGYAGTAMSHLMTATGLGKGGLYRHFESKEELAAEAFDYAWSEALRPRLDGLDACVNATERLLLMIRNFTEIAPRKMSGGCPLMNTAVDADDGNKLLRAKASSALEQWQDLIIGVVKAGQRSGEFRAKPTASQVAVVLISALEGALMVSRLERSRASLQAVRQHLEQYIRSLAA
jgi:TetR/AcrR family transcriptional repressor of nem operon